MALPNPVSLSHHFTNLIGRQVTFTRSSNQNEATTKHLLGVYKSFPKENPIVMSADRFVLGAFAGALVGFPDTEVHKRLAATAIDETMKDAISEVLNVASAVLSTEGRTVFVDLVTDQGTATPEVQAVVSKPANKLVLDVSIRDYQGGKIVLMS